MHGEGPRVCIGPARGALEGLEGAEPMTMIATTVATPDNTPVAVAERADKASKRADIVVKRNDVKEMEVAKQQEPQWWPEAKGIDKESRDKRWESGFNMPGEDSSSMALVKQMGAGMPIIATDIAPIIESHQNFMQSGHTIKKHDSTFKGKDGWLTFCGEVEVPPLRVHDLNSPALKQFDTMLFIMFACWKIRKMQAGRGRGKEIESCEQYISNIKSKTAKIMHGYKVEIDQEFLTQQFKAMKVQRLHQHGPAKRHRKAAFVIPHFKALKANERINWNKPICRLWWTMAETAVSLGYRVGEYTTDKFNPNINFSLGDLTWAREDGTPFNPKELMSRQLRNGERCMLAAIPSKTDRTLEKFAHLKFTLVYNEDDSVVNACRSLAIMERVRAVWDPVLRNKIPLFLDPWTGQAMTARTFSSLFAYFARITFGEKIASRFGTHSFRIGGATILRLLGCSDDEIMAWGRWSSDAYRRYVRAYTEHFSKVTMRMNSELVEDVDPENLLKSMENFMENLDKEAESLPPMSKAEVMRGHMSTEAAKKHLAKDCQSMDEGNMSEEEKDLPDINGTEKGAPTEAEIEEWVLAEKETCNVRNRFHR